MRPVRIAVTLPWIRTGLETGGRDALDLTYQPEVDCRISVENRKVDDFLLWQRLLLIDWSTDGGSRECYC